MNELVRGAGLDGRREPTVLVRSRHELELTFEFVAAHLAARCPDEALTVLQVGAFDGLSNDPVVDTLRMFGWRGVLVEPQPAPFAKLERLYRDNPDVQVFNVAISDRDGTRDLYTVGDTDGLPDFAQQIASFNRAHVAYAQRYVPDGVDLVSRIQPIPVTTITFDTLLRAAGVQRVDVLQIDAEGYDLALLRLFDMPRRLPRIVNYEHQHLSRRDRVAAADLLVECGYMLALSCSGDTVAYRQP